LGKGLLLLLLHHHVNLPEGGEGVVCDEGGLLQLLPPLLTQHHVTVQQAALPAGLEHHPPLLKSLSRDPKRTSQPKRDPDPLFIVISDGNRNKEI
jgi:hypothetical protein